MNFYFGRALKTSINIVWRIKVRGFLIIVLILQLLMISLNGIYVLRKMSRIEKEDGELNLIIKMCFSFSMIVVAFLLWKDNFQELRSYSLLILLGMCFSAIGDMIMASIIKFKNRLIAGMSLFSFAHIFYILAYVKAMSSYKENFNYLIFILLGMYIFCIILWKVFVFNSNKSLMLNIAALIYTLIICTMAAFAMNISLAVNGAWWVTTVGAFLFILSDFLIGISEIKEKGPKNQSVWVWFTYVPAQICIVYTLLLL